MPGINGNTHERLSPHLKQAIRNIAGSDSATQQALEEQFEREMGSGHAGNGRQEKRPARQLVTKPFEEIQSRRINWLWPGRIPLGKLTLLAGPGGLGKTYLTCYLMAKASTGGMLADGEFCQPAEVLFVSAEDDPEDTIKPRLELMGAEATRIHWLETVSIVGRDHYLSLADHASIFDEFLAERPKIKLIVIDPITAYLGKIDGNSDTHVRGALGPISRIASKRQVALLGIGHVSKGRKERAGSERMLGSVAFTNAGRAVWHLEPDPQDSTRRLMLRGKSNFPLANSLAFTIRDEGIAWEADDLGDLDINNFDGAPSGRHQGAKIEAAIEWLDAYMRPGTRVTVKQLKEDAHAASISRPTLYRAADLLQVERCGDGWWERGELT